jgi:hypothetical protein
MGAKSVNPKVSIPLKPLVSVGSFTSVDKTPVCSFSNFIAVKRCFRVALFAVQSVQGGYNF